VCRQACRDEHDLIGNTRNRLIDASRNIAKTARQSIVRHDAEPHLVCDEDDLSTYLSQRFRQGREMCLNILFVK
jgi:hypothetical protein